MAIEVEMKAWIDDPVALREALAGRCREIRSFFKSDTYFVAPVAQPAVDTGAGTPHEFRIRNDDGKLICTYKDKVIEDGMETNREVEFGVTDGEAFAELMRRIGCRVFVKKQKRGTLFECNELGVELSEVLSLGTFLEVEKVVEDNDPSAVEVAKASIRRLFSELGIPPEKVEPRPYNDILLHQGVPPG